MHFTDAREASSQAVSQNTAASSSYENGPVKYS